MKITKNLQNEKIDAFRKLLFKQYGIEEKYIINKTIEKNFEKYELLDELNVSATLTIDFTNKKYKIESKEFSQEINIVL